MASFHFFGNTLIFAFEKLIDWKNGDIRIALLGSGWTPNLTSNKYWADISTYEVSGTNYISLGLALANKSLTFDGSSVALLADDVVWYGSTLTARYAVIFDNTNIFASARPLIGYIDFGSDQSSTVDDFGIGFSVNGIWSISLT